MVIAADNDVALAEEHGRNPGLIKGTEAAQATGSQLMIPHFSDENIEAGLTDFNDLASESPSQAAAAREQLNRAITNAFSRAPLNQIEEWLHYNPRSGAEEAADQERTDAPEIDEKPLSDQNIYSGVASDQDSDQAREQAAWALSSGELKKEQKPVPPMERNARSPWDFRIGKDGAVEHFRVDHGRTALRETANKIHVLDRDHDAMRFALERAMTRFGNHLHFDGNQAGARTLVDLVVTHDLRITFTDERLNAQIELARVHGDLDRTAEAAKRTSVQKSGAGHAGELTPEKNIAGNVASQQTSKTAAPEVLIDIGLAPYDFEKDNETNWFVRTINESG
jgi:Large polyvalent protein-associated domain 7